MWLMEQTLGVVQSYQRLKFWGAPRPSNSDNIFFDRGPLLKIWLVWWWLLLGGGATYIHKTFQVQ